MLNAVHQHTAGEKPKHELAHIFDHYGSDFRKKHRLPGSHLKVMRHIQACRTAILGGHCDRCDSCDFEKNSYNSCRDRHCPKCQYLTTERWLAARKTELLPVGYYHAVFTLPHDLNPIILTNKEICLTILFKAVSETLQGFALDKKWKLCGQLGFIGILHTWNQKLLDHFHLHCLIPAGTLADDGKQWRHTKDNFLFPVKALAKVFRAKYMAGLKLAYVDNKLIFPGVTKEFESKNGFQKLVDQLFDKEKNWVVYAKKPFAGPEQVLKYLGRYTHRIAINNHRIVSIDDNKITFTYRDRADHNKKKVMTLGSDEFIRRFLLHVLPKGFAKIRHFGFLANKCKTKKLALVRSLLGDTTLRPLKTKSSWQEILFKLTGADLTKCPRCKTGRMQRVSEILVNNCYNDSS